MKVARAKNAVPGKRDMRLSPEDARFIERGRAEIKREKLAATTIDGIAATVTTGGRFRLTGFIRDVKALAHALVRGS